MNIAPDAELAYQHLLEQLRVVLSSEAGRTWHLVGIHSGGVWIAERLHADLALRTPLGTLSSAFHRDDYGRRGLPGAMKPSQLDFPVAGANIVLVDDILFTGRTVRAALNELFDYGRPRKVELAVLLDRGGRELPVEARLCGLRHALEPRQNYVFSRETSGKFALRIESTE